MEFSSPIDEALDVSQKVGAMAAIIAANTALSTEDAYFLAHEAVTDLRQMHTNLHNTSDCGHKHN